MADDNATPPAADPAKPGADPAPAPSGDPSAAKTLLTQGDEPAKADPAKEPAKPSAPVIPEKYEFKVPEGVQIDNAFVDVMTPVFKDLGLTQEQVNKLVEPYTKYGTELETKREADFQRWMKDSAESNIAAARKEWGNDFDGNLKVAQRGLARIFGAEGKRLLDETGLGNHPEFLKAFFAVGKMIQEDTPPIGQQPTGRKPSAAVLYPNTPGSDAAH